ncbi:HAD family hydrolase [Haloechinothrix sp. YIM 98757]|uniref:HAD family hydrolase n=1 Tax=Haloechinothrix aidingensis TaxID=2752311 RepID=A0A838AD85_9PSEU|nr:HAD family hydrolase [Haloechinothrix aidingensis]MBA0127249.1 HAD family hydrolase [Haloechinothrix aidingensis]
MKRPRYLAWDFGGTIARPGPEPTGPMVADILWSSSPATVRAQYAAAFDSIRTYVRESDRISHQQTPFSTMLAEAAQRTGLVLAEPARAVERIFTEIPDGAIDPRAAQTIRDLYRRGWSNLLACNTQRPEAVRLRTLERAGLAAYFTQLVLSSSLGVRKPHPAFYRAVVTAADTKPHEILFVGDTYDKDVRGPRRHGMSTVLISSPSMTPPADTTTTVVAHVTELPALLERDYEF